MQFQVPYVFKTLFSREPIEFEDMCETFAVSKGDLYLDMNETLPDVSDLEKEFDKLETKYKKGKISDTTFEASCHDLQSKIDDGHDLKFVGRVGQFCPILPGHGGGVLYRVNDGKKYAAPGSTGFRWLESETIKDANEDVIDIGYYAKLVDDAVDSISNFGDFEWFASDDPSVPPPANFTDEPEDDVPWDPNSIPFK